MDNNTFPGGGIPQSNRTIGTGEGEVPLAPPIQNTTMRTMNSDIKSMKDSGGGAPIPYTPSVEKTIPYSPTSPKPIPPASPIQPTPINQSPFSGSGMQKNSPFSQPPSNLPTKEPFSFSGGTPSPVAPMMQQFPPEPIKSGSGAVKGIVAFLVVVAVGLAGYFFVYPYFFPSTPAIPPVAIITPPPEAPVTPLVTPLETPQQPVVPPPEVPIHTSLFNIAADATTEVQLTQLTPDTLRTAVQFSTADVPILKEIVFRTGEPDGKGAIESLNKLAQMLAPQTFTSETAAKSFEPDFTFFVYSDKTGSWPGIIAKPKTDAVIDTLKTEIQKIEANGEARGFYLTDPGTTTGWKDGKLNTLVTRYASFSQAGASFNYAWLPNNSLFISTSYNGAKEAAKRLGY